MNRYFTRPELIEAYRLPRHVQDQLFNEVDPVEKTDKGEPLFLEAHVDAWLTTRYSTPPWRSGGTIHGLPTNSISRTVSNVNQGEDPMGFLTVAEAQRRYLAGEMSRRWWYRMANSGKIAHHRVGDSILFRQDDIEKFIAESRRAEHAGTPTPESAPPMPVVPPPVKRHPRRKRGDEEIGFRFFPR